MITVANSDIITLLRQENSWWSTQGTSGMKYSEMQSRIFLSGLKTRVLRAPTDQSVILQGARRVGKTVMIHHFIKNLIDEEGIHPECILYLQIDNPLFTGRSLWQLLDLYQEATGRDWKEEKCYVFFDEIKYLASWQTELKSLHDCMSKTRFVATSSAQASISKATQESGAGRFIDYQLPALLFSEYIASIQQTDLVYEDENGYFSTDIKLLNQHLLDYINFGAFPELALNAVGRREALRYARSDILDNVLLRDLPALFGIYDVREMLQLFTMLVYNSGHELSIDKLSQLSAVSKNTLKKYLDYLEAAFLVKIVRRVDQQGKRFQRDRTFKCYLGNVSVRTGLFALLEMDSEHLSHAVETALISQNFHHSNEILHYARWKSGRSFHEVEMLRMNTGMQIQEVVEVKFTDRVARQRKSWKPWLEVCYKNNVRELTITTQTDEDVIQVDGITVNLVPAAVYIYQQGAEEMKQMASL